VADEEDFLVLVSFPKSGNHWVKHYLAELLFGGDIDQVAIQYQNTLFQKAQFDWNGKPARVYSTHEEKLPTSNSGRKFRHAGIIHVIRHPLDCLLSALNYIYLERSSRHEDIYDPRPFRLTIRQQSFEEIVSGEDLDIYLSTFIATGTLFYNLPGAGSWLTHNLSYAAEVPDTPIVRMRYEDMFQTGAKAFRPIAELVGRSLEESDAAFLNAQRATKVDGKFYHRQHLYGYKEVFNERQLQIFRKHWGERVAAFGYEI